jgi:hypothetical protein
MFYISSQGHSGTGWLNKSLNMHPKVICWHGTRSIPPYDSGDNNSKLTPREFIEGLVQCEKKTFGEKVFGSIHGYYGVECKKYVEENKGKFFAVFRNPIAKINSIFSSFYVNILSKGSFSSDIKFDLKKLILDNNSEIDKCYSDFLKKKYKINNLKTIVKKFKFFKKAQKINKLIQSFKIKKRKKEVVTDFDINKYSSVQKNIAAIKAFEHACSRTFDTDLEIINNCNLSQILKMEDFISSKEYFKKIFFNITGYEIDNAGLIKVFENKDHINVHSLEKNINVIYEMWPASFKNVYKEYLKNIDLKNTYDKLEYKLFY